jgi:hypothetical protein
MEGNAELQTDADVLPVEVTAGMMLACFSSAFTHSSLSMSWQMHFSIRC